MNSTFLWIRNNCTGILPLELVQQAGYGQLDVV